MAQRRLDRESRSLFGQPELTFEPAAPNYPLPRRLAPTVADAPRRRPKRKRG
jgi:hypothetical protein